MSDNKDFLIEIGTEELPPTTLMQLSNAFAEEFAKELHAFRLREFNITQYAAPRRLALWVSNLAIKQSDQAIEKRGPAVKHAFDAEGKPSKAAEGFAKSNGVSVDELSRVDTEQGEYLAYQFNEQGKHTKDHLLTMAANALSRLPIAKRMRWGNGAAEFVRPVQWVLALFDNEVVSGQLFDLPTDNKTYGHRFHAPEAITITQASDYAQALEKAYVLADFATRKNNIQTAVEQIAIELNGYVDFIADADLLDEVAALNEWPVALYGSFDKQFLAVPSEALVSSMKSHQKYFPVFAKSGELLPYFITVSNIASRDSDKVKEGNERVIRPRLADAEFFWQQDQKQTLEDFNTGLKKLIYQEKLGSVYDKVLRVQSLATVIAEHIGADTKATSRAAILAKADLNTEMVGEFPKLQGVMGKYYAQLSGEEDSVANAIAAHYQPRYSGDSLPESKESIAVALADRLDTLIGIFACGAKPTGVKDPFGLRRAAIAVLRIIIDKKLALDLRVLLENSAANFEANINAEHVVEDVFDYVMQRLKAEYLQNTAQTFTPQQIDAVLSTKPTRPLDFANRLYAVAEFSGFAEAESLAAANKRIANLITKVSIPNDLGIQANLLAQSEEQQLYQQYQKLLPTIESALASANYIQILKSLAGLREAIDSFFDKVMVMAEDESIKHNRLALLQAIRQHFLQVADISKLQ